MKTHVNRWLLIIALIVAVIGFADASYLAAEHLLGGTPACSILEGCDVVTTSVYSTILGIPVALMGAIYYLVVAVSLIAYLDRKSALALKIGTWLPGLGFLASLYFVGLQLFVLEAICIYCMGSAISSTVLAVLGFTMWRQYQRRQQEPSEQE